MGLSVGTRLGPYEILAPLGEGGMGAVYRARDVRLDRIVAVKVLSDRLSADPEALARFQREGKTVAALSHPNILSLHDVGVDGGVSYAVMELLEGETMRERLLDGPLPPGQAIGWGVQIAEGLAAAHEKGLVHRDLKPENLFVTRGGRIKILDFGVAKRTTTEPVHEDSSTDLMPTEPGVLVGTAAYMSPEQIRGRPVDARSDIFSFGVVLYEMLAGSRPFKGRSQADAMAAILTEEAPPLADRVGGLPPSLERIVERCLAKEPEGRYLLGEGPCGGPRCPRGSAFHQANPFRRSSPARRGRPRRDACGWPSMRRSPSSSWPLAFSSGSGGPEQPSRSRRATGFSSPT